MYDAVKVPIVAPRSRASIENTARVLLASMYPQCLLEPQPIPMREIFDIDLVKGSSFHPVVADLPPGLEGITDCGTKEVTLAPEIYEGLERNNGRCRFAAAHEVGHVALHAKQLAERAAIKFVNVGGLMLARRSSIKPYRDPEWQANAFAAGLLMPEEMVRKLASQTRRYLLVDRIMNTFEVSREAADYRIIKLGL